jgi:phosphate transport system substrate-binding protein
MRLSRIVGCSLIVAACCCSASCSNSGGRQGEQIKLQGAGASFPAPLYAKWFKTYGAAHDGVQIDYQSVGSGSGVKAVIDKTVDFGASDAAMTPDEMSKVDVGVQALPMTAGSIVLAYNLEGVSALKLPRQAYVGIFLGTVKKWNDPLIAAANKGTTLPDLPINVVVRSDSSGTTYVFSKHLSAISEEFATSPGVNKMPNWPVGTRSKGNEGVAASLKTTRGAIGYLEYGYGKFAEIPMALLENKAGKFVAPTIASGQAALAAVSMPADLIAWLPDPVGDGSYPIVTYTWLLCYKKYPDAKKAAALKEVVRYCVTDGQQDAEGLGYIPLPAKVVQSVQAALKSIQ